MKDISNHSLNTSYKEIRGNSLPDFDYYFTLILSSIICFFGFRMNSSAVIIGAMVISPLLFSIVGVASSLFFGDMKQLSKEFLSLFLEISLILLIIFILGKIFNVEMGSEISTRINTPLRDYFLVAFFSGMVATFSLFWPKFKKSLVGVAIAIALIPPIVLVGIGLTNFDITMITSTAKIVVINLLGVVLGSILLLSFLKIRRRI